MRIIFQSGSLQFRFNQKTIKIPLLEAAGLLLCTAAAGLVCLGGASGRENHQQPFIRREAYGGEEKQYRFLVEGGGKEEWLLSFPVRERQYTQTEEKEVMENLARQLPELILGKNESLEQVRTDLVLTGQAEGKNIRISWQSDQPDRLSSAGRICPEEIPPEGALVVLTAALKGEYTEREIQIPITVYPPAAEAVLAGLKEEIAGIEQQSRTEEGFYLPAEYDGKAIRYQSEEQNQDYFMILLVPALFFLLKARKKEAQKKRRKEREMLLLLDYAQIVSKLQTFLGAGMSVMLSWEKIVSDDQQRLQKKGQKARPAYEEMLRTYSQIKSGVPEGKAYEDFGRRCGLKPYLKLSGLLVQNRKTGTKNLRQILLLEAGQAFEERKNVARRQGEEAATKLTVPLFLMLGIVMAIISLPAFFSIY